MTSPRHLQFGNINLTSGAEGDSTEMPPETPFRLLICGDLGGNGAHRAPFDQRKPILIDRDNFDEILARLAPSVTLPQFASGVDLTISFRRAGRFRTGPAFPEPAGFRGDAHLAVWRLQAASHV